MSPRVLVALAALASLPACATTVEVGAGHAAVALDGDGRFTRLDEGESIVAATARVDDFDLRQQTQGGTFTAISADGVPLVVGDPIVSYTLAPDALVALDRAVGGGGAAGRARGAVDDRQRPFGLSLGRARSGDAARRASRDHRARRRCAAAV